MKAFREEICTHYQTDGPDGIRSSGVGSGISSPPFLHSFSVPGSMIDLGNTKVKRYNLESCR